MLFLHYVTRKLVRRAANNALTIVVIAMVIAASMLGVSFLIGVRVASRESLPANHVLVTSQGAVFEQFSSLPPATVSELAVVPGLDNVDGKPGFSPQVFGQVMLERDITKSGKREIQAIRGIDPIGLSIHGVRIIEGRPPTPGAPELMVGMQAKRGEPGLKMGSKIQLPYETWEVVGVFSAGGAVYETEVWGDRARMLSAFKQERANVAVLVLDSAAALPETINAINSSKKYEATARSEREFRGTQAKLGQLFWIILVLVTALSTIGIFVTATNVHAALMGRISEFATMIVLGIRRGRVAQLVIQESLVISALGGIVAFGIAHALRAQVIDTFSSITAFNLELGLVPLLVGVALVFVVGIAGGLAPAMIVRRMDLVSGLR